MSKLLLSLSCLLVLTKGVGGVIKYPVSEIPEELKKDVAMVYREDQMTFIIPSRDRARQRNYVAITILSEKGKSAATRMVAYSKLTKVTSISGAVYDAQGNQVRKLKNNEILDQSATGSSLFSDDRVKIIDLAYHTYPYTIEFEYQLDYQFLFYVPAWYVVPEEQTSIQHSMFTVEYVPEAAPRFKTYNTDKKEVEKQLSGGMKSWTWEYDNIPPVEREPFGPALHEFTPVIVVAPGNFVYEGYSGNMSDWRGFGTWIQSLGQGRDKLSEETRLKLKTLVSAAPTDEEKVRLVYEYLQNHTRYVSIQIGIGGQQPFEASLVDQTGYGDCKALANYMIALLRTVDIPARYVLINAGANVRDIDPAFSSTQFNHAIVAVPLTKDTIWLECTSQTNPFGYSGRFTGDRHALMITEGGGHVVKTPQYSIDQNRQDRTADVVLTKDGNISALITTRYKGLQFENDNLDGILHQSSEDQKKWILENTEVPGLEIKSFSLQEKSGKAPEADVMLNILSRSYASVSGKRVFLNPNLANRFSYVPKKVDHRKTPVVRNLAYIDTDTIRFSIPEELYPEFLPPAVHYESRFGSYDASFTVEAGLLVYSRVMKSNKGVFQPEFYDELIEFYRNVSKWDNGKVVFLSKT